MTIKIRISKILKKKLLKNMIKQAIINYMKNFQKSLKIMKNGLQLIKQKLTLFVIIWKNMKKNMSMIKIQKLFRKRK